MIYRNRVVSDFILSLLPNWLLKGENEGTEEQIRHAEGNLWRSTSRSLRPMARGPIPYSGRIYINARLALARARLFPLFVGACMGLDPQPLGLFFRNAHNLIFIRFFDFAGVRVWERVDTRSTGEGWGNWLFRTWLSRVSLHGGGSWSEPHRTDSGGPES